MDGSDGSPLAAKREMLEDLEKGTYKPETYYNESEDGPYPQPEHVESQKRQLESLEQQLDGSALKRQKS